MATFAHRGVIEGFYGPPWSHADRRWLLERMGAWDMNRYVHAPKDDPLHRAEWRTAYPAEAMDEFAELIELGGRHGVDVVFASSPGLSIEYGRAGDVRDLVAKLAGFAARGAKRFCLCLDDVPTHLAHEGDRRSFGSLAEAHVALAHAVRDGLGASGGELVLVPTDYLGSEPTAYLAELGERLDPEIAVAWTGRCVVSPTITAEEARRRSETLRRRLLLWDNVPVNDGPMRPMLHLGPYLGRDPALTDHCSGALLNPMSRPRASAVGLECAAAWLRDPARYDAERAWGAAVRRAGRGAEADFARFAAAHRFWCGATDDRDAELEADFRAAREAVAADDGGPGAREAAAALRRAAETRVAVAETLRAGLEDRALLDELEPWIAGHHDESRRIAAAAGCLEALLGDASRLERALAFFAMEGRLTRIPLPAVASYGPRRVLYPQLVCMHDEAAGLGADPALFLDRNLADTIVAFVEGVALERLEADGASVSD